MPRDRKTLPTLVSTAVFILMEMAAIAMLSGGSSLQGLWINRAAHRFKAAVWGTSQRVGHYFWLARENERLAEENFDLMVRLRSLGQEEDSLRCASRTDRVPLVRGFRYFGAEIVKSSRNRQHNYLIINKGSADGVSPRCGLVTSKGVIGVVDVVGRHFAYALSFRNAEVSVSARLGEEGAVGPLVWDGLSGSGAILKEIPLQFKFEKGDTVYTSGFSSIFPPDIPLGTAGEARVVNGATHEIHVDLFEDYAALRYVTVVENTGREEIESLEKEVEP